MTMNVVAIGRQAAARSPASPTVRGSALLAMIVGSACASVPLPFGPVPMTLQSLAVLLAGVWGGPRLGAAVCVAYLGLGAAGLPVFAGAPRRLAWRCSRIPRPVTCSPLRPDHRLPLAVSVPT